MLPVDRTFLPHGVTKHDKKQYAIGNILPNTVASNYRLLSAV